MKKIVTKLILALTIFFTLFSCQRKLEFKVYNFDVNLRHFYGAAGYTVDYFVNQDSLKIWFDCDFENCKDTLVYEIQLDKKSVKDFYKFLISSRYDTLKSNYFDRGSDGRKTTLKICGDSIPSTTVNLIRYEHIVVENIINEVDKLIPDKKHRLYSYKYEDE